MENGQSGGLENLDPPNFTIGTATTVLNPKAYLRHGSNTYSLYIRLKSLKFKSRFASSGIRCTSIQAHVRHLS